MTKDPVDDGPFSLATILEEEYAALHGPLPAETTLGEKDRLAALYTHIHRLPRKRTALCLSGGGIRSATFGLGVLQGLARLSLLKQFDYLSTVSGGGYIGSWLTAWIHRHPDGVAGVTNELQRPPSDTQDPEPEPIRPGMPFMPYRSLPILPQKISFRGYQHCMPIRWPLTSWLPTPAFRITLKRHL